MMRSRRSEETDRARLGSAGSAGFQPAVSQGFQPADARPVDTRCEPSMPSRLEIGDTGDWKSALPAAAGCGTPGDIAAVCRACPRASFHSTLSRTLSDHFVENGRNSTKCATKWRTKWPKEVVLGQALFRSADAHLCALRENNRKDRADVGVRAPIRNGAGDLSRRNVRTGEARLQIPNRVPERTLLRNKFRAPIPASLRAFSLIEMMVAVTLLLVIISALLGVFYQTQRAFRLSVTQVDVLEGGRAVMELLTGELPETTHSYRENQINLYARTAFPFVIQPRPTLSSSRTNVIQDIYFLRQHNDVWIGTGYFVAPFAGDGLGTLYRFEQSVTNVTSDAQIRSLFVAFQDAIKNFPTADSHRVADRVVSLRLTPYNLQGQFMTNQVDADFSFTNRFVETLNLPAYVDLELGMFEPRAFEKYKALADPQVTAVDPGRAFRYLTNHVENVHLFHQRIPIRSEPQPSPVPPLRS